MLKEMTFDVAVPERSGFLAGARLVGNEGRQRLQPLARLHAGETEGAGCVSLSRTLLTGSLVNEGNRGAHDQAFLGIDNRAQDGACLSLRPGR